MSGSGGSAACAVEVCDGSGCSASRAVAPPCRPAIFSRREFPWERIFFSRRSLRSRACSAALLSPVDMLRLCSPRQKEDRPGHGAANLTRIDSQKRRKFHTTRKVSELQTPPSKCILCVCLRGRQRRRDGPIVWICVDAVASLGQQYGSRGTILGDQTTGSPRLAWLVARIAQNGYLHKKGTYISK